MAAVTFDKVTRRFPGHTPPAVDSLDLDIADGEFIVLVGPSGSGKSTALRMLAGLEDLDDGSIRIGDQDVTTVPPAKRDIAMVFQNYALYPHMDVADNIGFALKLAGVPKEERDRRVREAARLLDLTPLLGRKPKQLSGGQRQRVAMGRAIVRQPRVFLMDEPLSNLDAKLRVQTRAQIAELTSRLGVTTVYVTHDQVEAMTMGDRVAVLRGGVLQQVASPRVLYDRPANSFVASFIGSPAMNLLTAAFIDGGAVIGGMLRVQLPPDAADVAKATGLTRVELGVRPESFALLEPTGGDGLGGQVELVEELGSDAYVHVTADLPGSGPLVVRTDGRTRLNRGETVRLGIRTAELHAFDPDSGVRLGQ